MIVDRLSSGMSLSATQPVTLMFQLQSYVVLAYALGYNFDRCGGPDLAWPLGQRRIAEGVCGRGLRLAPHLTTRKWTLKVAGFGQQTLPSGNEPANSKAHQLSYYPRYQVYSEANEKEEKKRGLHGVTIIQISFNFPLIFQSLVHNKLVAFIRWGYKMHERVLFGKSVKVQVGPFSSREEQQVQRWQRMSRMSRHDACYWLDGLLSRHLSSRHLMITLMCKSKVLPAHCCDLSWPQVSKRSIHFPLNPLRIPKCLWCPYRVQDALIWCNKGRNWVRLNGVGCCHPTRPNKLCVFMQR